MVWLRVIQTFVDKHTDALHRLGTQIEVTEERAEELKTRTDLVQLVEDVSKETKKPTAKTKNKAPAKPTA